MVRHGGRHDLVPERRRTRQKFDGTRRGPEIAVSRLQLEPWRRGATAPSVRASAASSARSWARECRRRAGSPRRARSRVLDRRVDHSREPVRQPADRRRLRAGRPRPPRRSRPSRRGRATPCDRALGFFQHEQAAAFARDEAGTPIVAGEDAGALVRREEQLLELVVGAAAERDVEVALLDEPNGCPTARAPPTGPSVRARQSPCASFAMARWPAIRFGNVFSE